MQFLTRVLIVLAVLGGLGYGSYAFGKYILSARLFGPQTKTATTTASAGTLQEPSTPDVEIVPAQQPTKSDAGDAPKVDAQPTPTSGARVEITPADNGNDSGVGRDSTDNRPDSTPRPRRRRHRVRATPRPETRESSVETPQVQAPPARTQNVDPPARDNSSSDSNSNSGNNNSSNDTPRAEIPRVETPRRSDPVPTRRRERRTVPIPEPRNETPREAAPRIERRRESSPVPVPEGARGGNSSPVPIPG